MGTGGLIGARLHLRTSTERACAASPSARANSAATGARRAKPAARNFLHADALHKIGDRKAAARAGHAAGGQHMIGAAGVVAERLRAPVAEENASGGVDAIEQAARDAGQSEMLGRKKIDEANGVREIARDKHRAAFGKRAAREIRRRQRGELAIDFGGDFAAKARRGGNENRDGVGIVLGLSDQIGGDELRIAALGEDDRFGGAGEHVDGAIGADQPLGGGDEAIAGAENFVDARNRARAVGQRGDGLRAADARDRTHAQAFGGGEQRRARLRAGHDDLAHARFLGGNDGHQQGGDQREAPAGKIAADRFDGAHALAGAHARLDFDVPFERLLPAGHGANVARGVIDGGKKFARNRRAGPA